MSTGPMTGGLLGLTSRPPQLDATAVSIMPCEDHWADRPKLLIGARLEDSSRVPAREPRWCLSQVLARHRAQGSDPQATSWEQVTKYCTGLAFLRVLCWVYIQAKQWTTVAPRTDLVQGLFSQSMN